LHAIIIFLHGLLTYEDHATVSFFRLMSWDIRDVLWQLVAVGKEERRVNTFNRFDVVAEACDVVISIDSCVFVREIGKEGKSVEDVKTATF